jgi:hypothetical protein
VDGEAQQGNTIMLVDDGCTHDVELHVACRHDMAGAAPPADRTSREKIRP